MSLRAEIDHKYTLEKESIDKAKLDIAKGYEAAMKLTKEAMHEAKKMGYHLPMSRSL